VNKRRNALVVFAKAPLAGESKTRLVPPLTFEEAAALSRALLIDQLNHLSRYADAELFVAFAPESAAGLFAELVPAGWSCFPQQGEDLGERMRRAIEHPLSRGFRNVVLIGGDLPPIAWDTFHAAYGALDDGRDVVLGPAADGGYYLVGMSRPIADIFTAIVWSRADVFQKTVERIERAGLSYECLPPWRDIDTPEDLATLSRDPQEPGVSMKNVRALLQELRGRGKL
jgi:rSAM/selenodomain-associated transferase 1